MRLTEQECAFGTLLLRQDVCDPSIQFRRAGDLDTDALGFASQPGWGIDLVNRSSLFTSLE